MYKSQEFQLKETTECLPDEGCLPAVPSRGWMVRVCRRQLAYLPAGYSLCEGGNYEPFGISCANKEHLVSSGELVCVGHLAGSGEPVRGSNI